MAPERTIVIVGAGFSGAVLAANLLRSRHCAGTQIVLIERAARMARGKAYADREHPYLLNVPAGRMSVNPLLPLEFLSFAQHRLPHATAEDFLPRTLYGQYLEVTLLEAELASSAHVRLDRVRGEVCAVEKMGGVPTLRVQLADGRHFVADDVVLALGNPAPASLPGTESLLGTSTAGPDAVPCYIADPCAARLTFRPERSVLLIGTGLTMADIAVAAAAASRDQTHIHAISRHGLLPPSQTPFCHAATRGDRVALLHAASCSARRLFRAVRALADDTERRGGDWREAVTFVRNNAPQLWQKLPLRERRRMLRHVRPYWDVHRHRLPNTTLARLEQLQSCGRLKVHAGRLSSFGIAASQVRVTWQPRGSTQTRTLLVDQVINCTGPDYNARRSRDPLMRSLLAQGLMVADVLGLGIRTGAHGALLDSRGRPATNLFYVGPMLRADHWEATAAHELSQHAARLASYLAAPVGRLREAQGA